MAMKTIRLGDIGSCYSGLSGKKAEDFGHGTGRYITFLNVLSNEVIDTSIFEAVDVVSSEKQHLAKRGDLFFNTSSETPEEVGMCSYLSKDVDNLYLNSFCFGFRPTSNQINGLYLSYWFRSPKGRALMQMLAQGSTRYNLPKAEFLKATITIADYEEQKRIACALGEVDEYIMVLSELREKYEAMKRGMVKTLLSPKPSWKTTRLGEVVRTASGGTPSRERLDYYKGDIPWFTTGELKDCLLTDSVEHISKEGLQNSSAKIFPEGTLLIAMYGATIGKLGILTKKAATNQACCAIMCSKQIDTKFLFNLLLHRREEIISMGCGAGQPNISQQIVRNLELEFPSLPEQREIAEKIEAIDGVLGLVEAEGEKAESLKCGLMKHFFG